MFELCTFILCYHVCNGTGNYQCCAFGYCRLFNLSYLWPSLAKRMVRVPISFRFHVKKQKFANLFCFLIEHFRLFFGSGERKFSLGRYILFVLTHFGFEKFQGFNYVCLKTCLTLSAVLRSRSWPEPGHFF